MINFDLTKFSGFTPLQIAVQFDCIKVIEILIDHSANICAKEARRLIPLFLAYKNEKIIDLPLSDQLNNIVENPTNESGPGVNYLHPLLKLIFYLFE